MKTIAFAPGHISGFFEPVYNANKEKTGSRGAGINVNLGAISDVSIKESKNQVFEFYLNNKKLDFPVLYLAMKNMLGKNPVNVQVKTHLDLPLGQGFGMSAAIAVSATYALAKIINVVLEVSKYVDNQAFHLGELLSTFLEYMIWFCVSLIKKWIQKKFF